MTTKILVTGSSGFIGFHLCRLLLGRSFEVVGIDNMNDYYDPVLKEDRLTLLDKFDGFTFHQIDIADRTGLDEVFAKNNFDVVVHLAAQAGVRHSITNPYDYVDSNLLGFVNVLEACRNHPVKHLMYASSSSVYGGNTKVPFSTNDKVDHPVSLYAATKKSNELMAHAYSNLYDIPTTGLRFFTVYGPWGRPDMAYFLFAKSITAGKPIKVFNHGQMERDFTYIDDIVEGIFRLIDKPPLPNPEWNDITGESSSSFAPYKIYNIGSNNPVQLLDFIKAIEKSLGIKAQMNFMDMQPGDVLKTYADVLDLEKTIGFKPTVTVAEGVAKFVDWYKKYYDIDLKR